MGTLPFDNVLVHRGGVRIIDFDDCGFGYFLYDIAALLDRIEWREDYPRLRTAMLEGYREQRSLSANHEALLDLFLLVRWAFLGIAFLSAPEYAPGRAYAPRFLKIVVPKMRRLPANSLNLELIPCELPSLTQQVRPELPTARPCHLRRAFHQRRCHRRARQEPRLGMDIDG